jgi:hypothetical protein
MGGFQSRGELLLSWVGEKIEEEAAAARDVLGTPDNRETERFGLTLEALNRLCPPEH